ncbi:MAG: ribosome silencing factor [Endomicrobium sp.]|jgi:ribosome-associated protein|nr:ribosome silencing factor [Endomicrobium sp.]
MKKNDFYVLALKAAKIAQDKKAGDTLILDVRDLTAESDYFVIATAQSSPQINAVCDEIEKIFKEESVPALRREGVSSSSWRVIDYGGLVVHVMSPLVRETYKLERLWDGAKNVKFKDSPVLKIIKPQQIKELENAFEKTVKESQKRVTEVLETGEEKVRKAVAEGTKKALQTKKTVQKVSKKVSKQVKEKVKKAKKMAFAFEKGVEAFKNTLFGADKKKKAKNKKSVKVKIKKTK